MAGRGAASILLLCALAATPATAAPRLLVLVLTPSATGAVQTDAFLLALSLQLDPYDIRARGEPLVLPPSLAAQATLAQERGARASATAVVWFTEELSVTVHLLDLRHGQRVVRSLAMGPPTAGIERSMAAAVRTLLRASPLVVEERVVPERRVQPRPDPASTASPHVARPLLQVGAGYAVEGLPLGPDLRHGPEIDLSIRIWRRVEGRLTVGYRLPRGGQEARDTWSQSAWCASWATSASWALARRWEVLAGPRIGFAAVQAEARTIDGTRTERASLWELSVGGEGAGRVRLGRRIGVELAVLVAWLPIGRVLSIGGREVSRSGGLSLSASLAAYAGFF